MADAGQIARERAQDRQTKLNYGGSGDGGGTSLSAIKRLLGMHALAVCDYK